MTASASPSLLRMAAPLVVSFWMRAGVTFVDTIYASLIGGASVAAVGLTIPLEFLMVALWVGLSTGLTARLSRAMGAGDGRQVEQYLAASWRMVLVLAPLFTLVGAGTWFIAPHLGLEEGVARALGVYGTVLLGGSAWTMFWSIIPDSLVKAHQDTRSTMWAGIWTNGINLGLNTLFLFAFGWGVFGIALSTVIGRLGGLVYAIRRANLHERRRRAATPRGGTPDPQPYRSILALAVPSSLTFVLMAAETGLVNVLLARRPHATEAIAAYSIYYRAVLFCMQPMIATAVAMLPFAAHRLGAADWEGTRRGLKQASVAATLYAVGVVAPIVFPLAPWIARQLADSELLADYTTFALRAVPLACLAGSSFLLCRPVFESMQRGRPGLLMALLRYLVLAGPLAWAGIELAQRLGRPGLHGLIAGTLVAGALTSALFHVWLGQALGRAARAAATR